MSSLLYINKESQSDWLVSIPAYGLFDLLLYVAYLYIFYMYITLLHCIFLASVIGMLFLKESGISKHVGFPS